MNALLKFREIASKKMWKILANEQFKMNKDGKVLNIKSNLQRIKNSGIDSCVRILVIIYKYKLFNFMSYFN